jgi:hypothetical protein
VENLLAELGQPVKRGPGRPKGSGRRGPGRPKGAAKVAATPASAKRGPGRPKGPAKKVEGKGAAKRRKPKWTPEARAEARERMKAYWASRKNEANS